MKKYTPEQKLIRKELANCIIKQRHLVKQLRDFCKYSICKRKLNGIIINREYYLEDALKDMDKLRYRREYLLTLLFDINCNNK